MPNYTMNPSYCRYPKPQHNFIFYRLCFFLTP